MPAIVRIYGECLAKVPGDIARSPWVLVLPMIYFAATMVAGSLLGVFGIIGGFIMGFVECGLWASFLFFLDEVVNRSPVKFGELPRSFQRYFWPVMNVMFVLWIASILIGLGLRSMPNGGVIESGIWLVVFILLNAVPEVIYQRRVWNGMDVVMGSVNFIQENWIEWFIPNLLLAAGAYFGVRILFAVLLGALGTLGLPLFGVICGAVLLPVMSFRGHLFAALDGSSARGRRFRYGR